MQNHHLSKLIITSTTTSESEGFALRRLLKENWQQLLPDLTDSFDAICAEDEVIHLPKIIISLEINSTHSLVSNMPITHNETLKEQIKTQVMLQVQEFKAELNNSLSECTNINPIEHLNELSNKSKTNTNSNVLLIWQDVQSYLISGILPWYIMHQESVKDLIPQNNAQSLHLSMQLLIKNNIHQCMNALFEDRSSQTINRLVQLCDDDLRKYIFEQLIEQAFSKLKLLQIEKIDDAQLCSDALVYICGEILNEAVNPIELTNVLFNQLLGVQTAQDSVKNTSIQSSTLSRLIAKSAKRFTISEKVLTTLSSRIFSQSNIERNVKSESKIQELQADKIKPLDNILDDKLFKDTRSVLFAGSILLYPYLYRLFKELGYLSADKKIKQSKQSRAVTLMIYLLRGEEQVFDYQLHFVKWLLGVPSNVLIIIEENSINKEEIAEADNVLLSLKAHWAVLKNTSFTNIRESFLQRPGMMKLYDEQCHITIERKGIDVLIDQIPFSLSMIRLPWIKQQIIVTW